MTDSKKRESHADLTELEALMPHIRKFQALADRHGIKDVFQDNGGKVLQLLLVMNILNLPGREGNDAVDENGVEYELKTLNINNRGKGFTTHHHLNPTIIAKYRQVPWIFAAYEAIELKAIYRLDASQLTHLFDKWEEKWHADGGKDLNNPKIPLAFIVSNGELVYGDPIKLKGRSTKRTSIALIDENLLFLAEDEIKESENQ